MGMLGDEILKHTRSELERSLSADGHDVAQHELAAAVDRMLPQVLAWKLANAMTCAGLAEHYFEERMADHAKRQLWNWE